MENFSLFKDIWSKTPVGSITLEQMHKIITSNTLKPYIDKVRSTKSKEEKDNAKMLLPNVTLNGVFSKRGNTNIIEYSGLTCLDFDHIPLGLMQFYKDSLINWPYTVMLFTSPSGDGLKLVIRHDLTDHTLHWNMYGQLTRMFKDNFGCPYVDTCTKDLQRPTYLTYDPDCCLNPNAQTWHFEFDPTISQTGSNKTTTVNIQSNGFITPKEVEDKNAAFQSEWSDKSLVNYIDKHQWSGFPEDYQEGHRNDSILKKAGQLYRCGVSYDVAVDKLVHLYSEVFSTMPKEEVISKVSHIYSQQNNNFGCDRQKWIDKKNANIKRYRGGMQIGSPLCSAIP